MLAGVAQAEAGLAEAAATARASSLRLDELMRQIAELAATHRLDARVAESAATAEVARWRVEAERLERQLADREEECCGLRARLQVRL